MRLEKDFAVGVPLERAWQTLSDVGAIASCVPGAELRAVNGMYTGRVEVSAGTGRLVCEATVRVIDRDDDKRVTTISGHGRQLGGPAVGDVTLQGRIEAVDSSTQVVLSAEIRSSGHEQTPDAVENAARQLLDEVAERLSERMQQSPPPQAVGDEVPQPGPSAVSGERVAGPPARRAPDPGLVAASGGFLLLALVLWRLLVRRRQARW